MAGVVLSSKIPFFKYSHAFSVYSGQLLAWRKASTVARAFSVWIGSREVGSGLVEGMVSDVSR